MDGDIQYYFELYTSREGQLVFGVTLLLYALYKNGKITYANATRGEIKANTFQSFTASAAIAANLAISFFIAVLWLDVLTKIGGVWPAVSDYTVAYYPLVMCGSLYVIYQWRKAKSIILEAAKKHNDAPHRSNKNIAKLESRGINEVEIYTLPLFFIFNALANLFGPMISRFLV